MPRTLTFFAVALLGAFLCSAAESAPDIGPDLDRAHKAWRFAQSLESKVRGALAAGAEQFAGLLAQQDTAYQQAQQAFEEALKKSPENPAALADFGRFWIARKDLAQARRRLEAALRSSEKAGQTPRDQQTVAPLAAAEEADVHRALGGLLERSGDSGLGLERYRRAFALDPSDPRNRLSLAVAFAAAGEPHETLRLLGPWAEANSAAPDFPGKRPEILALGLYSLALAREETGFFEDALGLYRKAREQAGQAGSAGIAEHAGLAVARLEDFFDALPAPLAPGGRGAGGEGVARPAPPSEREALARASDLCDRGVQLRGGALDEASFAQALAAARAGGDEASAALARHAAFDAFQAAMLAFQEAVMRAPRLARGYFELARCNQMLGRLGAARKLADEAALNSPNSLAILSLQGDILLDLGQWEEAARAFERLRELEPDSGRASFGLARACAGLQDSAERCRAGLAALRSAEQLGVRDWRMVPMGTLELADGRVIKGFLTEEPEAFVVRGGEKPERFLKSEIKDSRREPGLREQIAAVLQRFERGERPVPRPTLRGSSQPPAQRPADALNPWGTILDR